MYLKSLKLTGFKSFADPTRLEFEPGVSVVVGPNGTGKSNIVDAIAWVLGSQFTKELRTERMDEVVFAGTAARNPFSKAEVTVVLDNGSRLLPLDLEEVSITRRLYRGGISEYEINGVDCRLLDIQELLSDGGMGRSQHMIVGQGRLDSIPTAKGERRRRIIEEAAGILKHQARKAKAVRRLEHTDDDILRLHDILKEIQRRRRPLRRQAEAAERYGSTRAELRSLRIWLGGEDLRRLRERSAELTGKQRELEEREAAAKADLARLEAEAARMRAEREAEERALERASGAAARLETVEARLRGIVRVAQERAGGLSSRLREAEARRRRLEAEAERLTLRLEEAGGQEQRARRDAEAGEEALRAAEDRRRALPDEPVQPAEADLSRMRSDLRSLEASSTRDAREAEQLAARLADIRGRLAEEAEQAEATGERLGAVDERLTPARRACEAGTEARRSREAEWERSGRLLRSAEAVRIAAAAKAETLEESSGCARSAAAERLAGSSEVIGRFSALLDVPGELAAAAGAAVGGWAEALVFEGAQGLRRAVGEIKSEGLGGLSFMVPPRRRGEPPALPAARRWGVEALLDRLGAGADPALAGALLGDVILVEGWSTAWDICRRDPGIRAVTPEGDLITAFGIRPAAPGGASPGALDAALRAAVEAAAGEALAGEAEAAAQAGLEAARREEQAALDELAALEAERTEAAGALERLERSRTAGEGEAVRLAERLASLRRAGELREHRIEELAARIEAGESSAEEGPPPGLFAREREAVENQYRTERQARDRAIQDLGAAVERRRMLADRLTGVTAELEGLEDAGAEAPELGDVRSVERLARRALEVASVKRGELAERRSALEGGIADAERRLAAALRQAAEADGSAEAAREELGRLAVEAAELRVREETVAEGLRRDADASPEQALAMAPPSMDEDPAARAERLAAELSRMGPINPLAAEEFREIDERHRLISDQLSDLETSRAELDKVIAALDDEMEARFLRTFEDAARYYRRFFTVLFPGGAGGLSLTGADNPLEAGVEIEAQPLGKRIGKPALLSGGERSLAALAFLFAVFKSRPSPFYILDEVDAALDDANLHRFLRLVDEFRDEAQLIVVTHQQATMRAADVLYGVTMEPGGTSQALVKRLDEAGLPA